jgi:hypothetical protein
MTDQVCATPGCPNPVAARHGTTGRPPIYCSRACRLALRVTRRRVEPEHDTTQPAGTTSHDDGDGNDGNGNDGNGNGNGNGGDVGGGIAVQMGQDPDDPTPMRSWTVTIHRGPHAVTVAHGLGRFAATALTGDLQQLFNPNTQQDARRRPID